MTSDTAGAAVASEFTASLAAAWNQHDMTAFASLFHDDAAFVNVAGTCMRGREEIERAHAAPRVPGSPAIRFLQAPAFAPRRVQIRRIWCGWALAASWAEDAGRAAGMPRRQAHGEITAARRAPLALRGDRSTAIGY